MVSGLRHARAHGFKINSGIRIASSLSHENLTDSRRIIKQRHGMVRTCR
jgi:hypothetical protein